MKIFSIAIPRKINKLPVFITQREEHILVLDAIMLGLGFVEGIVYLAAYLSLKRGWFGGTSYLLHGTSVISCMMIAVSNSHSAAWPSVAMNMVFVFIGAVFMTKKRLRNIECVLHQWLTYQLLNSKRTRLK